MYKQGFINNAWRSTLLLGALALAACNDVDTLPGGGHHDHDHGPVPAEGRLVIGENHGGHGHVHVYDLHESAFAGEFDVDHAVTAIHASPGQRYAVVIQRDNDRVNFVDGGLWVEDHGDHDHAYAEAPRLMDLVLSGVRPTHYEAHDGIAALFNDGLQATDTPAGISLFSDASIGNGLELATHTFPTFQHGTAEPRGEWMLTTHRDAAADGTLPDRVDLLHLHGDHFHQERRFDTSCEGLHGSASNHDYSVFGCLDGVLVIHQDGDTEDDFHDSKIAVPERIGTLIGHHDLEGFGGFAGQALYAIDPDAGTADVVDWRNGTDVTRAAFAMDAHGERFLILDSEGTLHVLDPRHGWQTVTAVPGVTGAAPAGVVIAVSHGEDRAFLLDPATQSVVVVDLDHGEVEGEIALGFTPVGLAWVGVRGGEGHDDDHGHGHSH